MIKTMATFATISLKRQVFIFLTISVFVSCQNQERTTTEQNTTYTPKNTTEVSISEAKTESFVQHLLSNGRVVAHNQSRLSFKINGIIEKIYVANGSIVQGGQLLATLDRSSQELSLQQALVQLKEARLELNKLLIEYGGEDQDSSSVKPRIWEAVKTKSGYYRAVADVANARLQLQNTELRTPYSATVANLKTKAYNPISATESFCVLLGREAVWVEFSVLETELSTVKIGQIARVTPIAYTDKHYKAQVVEINPFVDEQGLVLVKAKVLNADKQLFEGMNTHVRLEKTIANQIIVPKAAVVERNGRKVAFVYQKGLAKWHYVSIGHENETQLTITDGLKAGEQVIVEGNLNIGHDARVSVKK